MILVRLQRAIPVFNLHLFRLDQEVRSDIGPRDFATVGAVAEMTAAFGEEVVVGYGYRDAAAETAADQLLREGGGVVGVRVAGGSFGWHCVKRVGWLLW